MIGKPEWFTRRKYFGWGLYPKTWQGWAYVAVSVLIILAIQSANFLSERTRIATIAIYAFLLLADFIDIAVRMKKDERETIHEAISERNALWTVIIVLAIGLTYQSAQSTVANAMLVDPFIIAALVFGLVAKAASNIYLDRKD